MACRASNRLPGSFLSRPRSRRSLQPFHRKRCVPNREEPLLCPEKARNSACMTTQLNPWPSVPLQQDYAQTGQATRHAIVRVRSRSSPAQHVASPVVPSWNEHLSQRERMTKAEKEVLEKAWRLHSGATPPEERIYLSVRN